MLVQGQNSKVIRMASMFPTSHWDNFHCNNPIHSVQNLRALSLVVVMAVLWKMRMAIVGKWVVYPFRKNTCLNADWHFALFSVIRIAFYMPIPSMAIIPCTFPIIRFQEWTTCLPGGCC